MVDSGGNSVRNAKSTSKDVPPWDGTPRSTKFRVRECLKYGILRIDLRFRLSGIMEVSV